MSWKNSWRDRQTRKDGWCDRIDSWQEGQLVGQKDIWQEVARELAGRTVCCTEGRLGRRTVGRKLQESWQEGQPENQEGSKDTVGRKLKEKGCMEERVVGRTVGRTNRRERTLKCVSWAEGQLDGRAV